MIEKYIGKKVLVSCSNYFTGPDSHDHNAVWGTLTGIHKVPRELGFQPSRSMANWYYEIGGVLIMGCQINYLCLCPEKPNTSVGSWNQKDGVITSFEIPNRILITE